MRMWQQPKGPILLVLNGKSREQIAWHCEHYEARGLMARMDAAAIAKRLNVSVAKLKATFDEYNEAFKNPNGAANKWGKNTFQSMPYETDGSFSVAEITPVMHYCMGGVAANELAQVITKDGKIVPGLYVAGEAQGGVHGENRLGGSSLLDCVVYGPRPSSSSTSSARAAPRGARSRPRA